MSKASHVVKCSVDFALEYVFNLRSVPSFQTRPDESPSASLIVLNLCQCIVIHTKELTCSWTQIGVSASAI